LGQQGRKKCTVFIQFLSDRETRTYMGKARKTESFWSDFLVCIMTTCRLNSVELVKWADGEKKKFEQTERENVATNLAGGGNFLYSSGRGNFGSLPANGRGGCPAFPAGGNRAPSGSDSEYDACHACAGKTGRTHNKPRAARSRLLVWRGVQWP
jgi:hypothetical protein